MTKRKPKISVLVTTYNRSHLIEDFIEDLMKQTYQEFELLILNNGSTDETEEILKKYKGRPKIRILTAAVNMGCLGGYNFLMDQIEGEWFALLGDDDRIKHHAFERMLKVLDEVDPTINAVTANAIDVATGDLAGRGLYKNQFLPIEKLIAKASGEFLGLTKTELLGDKRYNEKLTGEEDTFYYRIDAIANRYYIHEPLKFFGKPGVKNITTTNRESNANLRVNLYKELLNEPFYWEQLRRYAPKRYTARCIRGLFFLKLAGEKEQADAYREMLSKAPIGLKYKIVNHLISRMDSATLQSLYGFMTGSKISQLFSKILVKNYSQITS